MKKVHPHFLFPIQFPHYWGFIGVGLGGFLLWAWLASAASASPSVIVVRDGFTVSTWINFNRLDGAQTFVSQDGHAVSRFALQKRPDNRLTFVLPERDAVDAPVYAAVSDFAPTPGQWYQIAGVYDPAAKQARLYADGVFLASVAVPAVVTGSGPLVIRRGMEDGRPADFMDGAINELQSYASRALNDAQVAALYAAEQTRFLPHTFTWANPIYYQGNGPGADIHDPDILNDNGVYYCVATMAPFRNYTDRAPQLPDLGSAPGISLYASRDLKVWKFQNWLLKSSELPEDCPYKHQFWAPELHKFNGRYYVIFGGSNWIDDKYNIGGHMGYYQFVGVADKITGTYKHFVALKGPGVDTSLFQDDDGKTYAVWPWNEIHPIDLTQIDQDKVTVGPKVSQATIPADFKAIGKAVPNTVEGPYLIKRAGTYYCFFAETYPDLYATGIAMSRSLAGPWHLDPRWRVFPGGHQAEFVGPDGRWWTAYKHERSETTPWLSIDPIDFDADGMVQMTPTTGLQRTPLNR